MLQLQQLSRRAAKASKAAKATAAWTRSASSKSAAPAASAAAASGAPFRCTLFPGDGIGPEISKAVQTIFEAARVPVEWEHHTISTHAVTPGGDLISAEALESVVRNKVGLKGPFATPFGKGHRSLNLTLRKALNLYANVRPCKSIPGYKTKYDDVDIVTIRENTEGEYTGIEHEVVPGVIENLKVITRAASSRIAEFAFRYASEVGRKKVTAAHKAGVMKLSDGLFLDCCREVAAKYPQIKYEEVNIDNAMLYMASDGGAKSVAGVKFSCQNGEAECAANAYASCVQASATPPPSLHPFLAPFLPSSPSFPSCFCVIRFGSRFCFAPLERSR